MFHAPSPSSRSVSTKMMSATASLRRQIPLELHRLGMSTAQPSNDIRLAARQLTDHVVERLSTVEAALEDASGAERVILQAQVDSIAHMQRRCTLLQRWASRTAPRKVSDTAFESKTTFFAHYEQTLIQAKVAEGSTQSEAEVYARNTLPLLYAQRTENLAGNSQDLLVV